MKSYKNRSVPVSEMYSKLRRAGMQTIANVVRYGWIGSKQFGSYPEGDS